VKIATCFYRLEAYDAMVEKKGSFSAPPGEEAISASGEKK
jgi:hypothetical protein